MSRDGYFHGGILPQERDVELNLSATDWPKGCPLAAPSTPEADGAGPWTEKDGYLIRRINPGENDLWEAALRFPNAPIYGIHDRAPRLHPVDGRSNFHTLRVIGRSKKDRPTPPEREIQHVYILHNGLNETKEAELHYELASHLLSNEPKAVCILRPFPSHLTRYAYSAPFTEHPLDIFLLDSGDLFRQFIRFMLETRWLLSILSPRRQYDVITGGSLVTPDSGPNGLARKIHREWKAMDDASKGDPLRPPLDEADVTETAIGSTIRILREEILSWEDAGQKPPTPIHMERPAIHLAGYSLGGFVAQSAFFAWPYAISTCVTLFGGGELRKLAPTAFAQPEEWQSVLHSLRYELDRAMRKRLEVKGGKVRGVPQEEFEYLLRIFYEVFLQYYQGSYQTRLAEFVQRMLFVTGGQDPIVQPKNVMDAAPPDGVNQISIAKMSHFPTHSKEKAQQQQREFWLEQVGKVVPSFAKHADQLRRDVLQRSWLNQSKKDLHVKAKEAYKEYKQEIEDLGQPPASSPLTSGIPLADRWFGKELEHIGNLIGTKSGEQGWVLVSRNELPPVFQSEAVLRRYAAALHHSEDLTADEFSLALQRRDTLRKGRHRVTLMVPEGALKSAWKVESSMFPSRSETPGVPRLDKEQLEEAKEWFTENWLEHESSPVRPFYPGDLHPARLGEIGLAYAGMQGIDSEAETSAISVRFLPDVWIGISAELLAELHQHLLSPSPETSGSKEISRGTNEDVIVRWAAAMCDERSEIPRGSPLDPDDHPHHHRLQTHLESEPRGLSVVEFSRAALNPRYRGQCLTGWRRTSDVLIHWAMAYRASQWSAASGSKTKLV